MFKAGIPTIEIMKISGHQTEKEFLKYILIDEEETAERLSVHPYFNQPVDGTPKKQNLDEIFLKVPDTLLHFSSN